MTETAFIPLLHFHRFVLSILDQVLLLCRCIGRAGGGEFADRHRATGQVPAPRRRRGRRQEPDAGADGTGAGEAGRGGRRGRADADAEPRGRGQAVDPLPIDSADRRRVVDPGGHRPGPARLDPRRIAHWHGPRRNGS